MANEGIQIHGLKELEKRLQALPEKLRRKSIRKVLNDSAEIIRTEAVIRVPKRKPLSGWMAFLDDYTMSGEGHLKDNILTKVTVGNQRSKAIIGIDYKKVHHGHLVEFGHRVVIHGKTRGRTRKFPFMRPAFEYKGDEALNSIITKLRDAVEREA